jgi:hypothetical protein
MAKRAKKRTAAKPVRRRRSRVEREQRMRRYIVWTTIVVGVAVVGLVAYGLVSQQIRTAIQMRQPVAVVNGTEIPMKTLRDRARFYEGLQQSSLSPSLLDYVLDEVIQEELVRQEAERRGIEIAPAELQDRIERMFDYHSTPPTPMPTSTPAPTVAADKDATPTPEVTPGPTATPKSKEDFQREYNEYLSSVGVTDEYFRTLMEGALLQEALLDEFGETVPAEMDQVQLQYLRVYSDTQANELFIRLLSEETDFATLREEIESPDAEISGIGGDLKWYPKALLEEQFSVEFAEEAFALGTGVFTQTIESEYGGTSYYVVEIVAHEERLVDDQNRTLLARIAFDQWLEEQMALVERLDYDATALFPESAGIETNPLGQ